MRFVARLCPSAVFSIAGEQHKVYSLDSIVLTAMIARQQTRCCPQSKATPNWLLKLNDLINTASGSLVALLKSSLNPLQSE